MYGRQNDVKENKGHVLPLFRFFSGSCLSALRLKAKFFFLKQFYFYVLKFVYLFLAVLGHCFCAQTFSSCPELGLLIVVASLVSEGSWAH